MQARERVLFEGLVAGLIAYGVVALVFALGDILTGRPLFQTPAVVGSLLFYGAGDVSTVRVAAGPVAAANGVHILLAVAVGLAASLLARETETHPQFFYITVLAVVIFLLASTAVLLGVPSALTRAAPWVVVLLANLAGAIAAAYYLWRMHPTLREHLQGDGEVDDEARPAAAGAPQH